MKIGTKITRQNIAMISEAVAMSEKRWIDGSSVLSQDDIRMFGDASDSGLWLVCEDGGLYFEDCGELAGDCIVPADDFVDRICNNQNDGQ